MPGFMGNIAHAAKDSPTVTSGLPIPRYVSLKSDHVNVRAGPTKDNYVAWIYTRAGLPVEITAEFENWRRVRDSEGSEGWVYHSMLSGRRTAVVTMKSKNELAPLYSVKRLFVQRRAMHKVKPEDARPEGFQFTTELDFARQVNTWLHDEAVRLERMLEKRGEGGPSGLEATARRRSPGGRWLCRVSAWRCCGSTGCSRRRTGCRPGRCGGITDWCSPRRWGRRWMTTMCGGCSVRSRRRPGWARDGCHGRCGIRSCRYCRLAVFLWRQSRCWPGITRRPRRNWSTGIRSFLH